MTLTHIKYVEEYRQREKRISERQKKRLEREQKEEKLKKESEEAIKTESDTKDKVLDESDDIKPGEIALGGVDAETTAAIKLESDVTETADDTKNNINDIEGVVVVIALIPLFFRISTKLCPSHSQCYVLPTIEN
jgi:phage-related tail protein